MVIEIAIDTIADPYNLPVRHSGGPKCTPVQLRDACCYLANMIEYISKAAVCCVG